MTRFVDTANGRTLYYNTATVHYFAPSINSVYRPESADFPYMPARFACGRQYGAENHTAIYFDSVYIPMGPVCPECREAFRALRIHAAMRKLAEYIHSDRAWCKGLVAVKLAELALTPGVLGRFAMWDRIENRPQESVKPGA